METTKMVYFQGSRTSPSRLFDEKGSIGVFTNRGGDVVTQSDGTKVRADNQVWIMEIPEDDKETLERVQKHPDFKAGKFRQVTHIPKTGTSKAIFTGATPVEGLKKQLEAELREKFKTYYLLEDELLTKDGKVKVNADPEKVKQFETLKKELEI